MTWKTLKVVMYVTSYITGVITAVVFWDEIVTLIVSILR